MIYCWCDLQPTGWTLKEEYLPAGWLCLVNRDSVMSFRLGLIDFKTKITNENMSYIQVCGASAKQELPPNFIALPKDAYTPDVIAASDCMLGIIYESFTVTLC